MLCRRCRGQQRYRLVSRPLWSWQDLELSYQLYLQQRRQRQKQFQWQLRESLFAFILFSWKKRYYVTYQWPLSKLASLKEKLRRVNCIAIMHHVIIWLPIIFLPSFFVYRATGPTDLILDDLGRTVDARGRVIQLPKFVPTIKVSVVLWIPWLCNFWKNVPLRQFIAFLKAL